jgi:hypothetical protein
MAINSQKLLPTSAIVKWQKQEEVNEKKEKKANTSLKKELLIIRKNLISIDKILRKDLLLYKKTLETQRKIGEKEKFRKKEQRLEKKPEKELEKEKEAGAPQLGIFDRINRFITFTFLGWLTNKLFKYIPQLLDFTKKIGPVVEFFESFIGNTFKGIVDFIDFGYDTHEKVKKFAKNIGGENFEKTFDNFSRNLNTFINLAIVAGMATMGGTDFGLGKKGGKPGPPSRPGQGGRPRITTSGGGAAGRPDIRSPLRSGPRITTSGGAAAGRFAGLGGRIPIIGGLISFVINVLSGEPVGRAAAKAVGFSIGSALGTFVPVPFAGTILGGILGDIVGGALYDTLVSNKPEKPEIKAKAKGGQVTTRKGKVVGGAIRRTVRKTTPSPKAIPPQPGKSVGGKQQLQKMFPEPQGQQVGKTMSPYGFLNDTVKTFADIPFLGSLFNIFGKVIFGDLPSKTDYQNVGLGINAWINNAISLGFLQGNLTKAFADGGIVDGGMTRNISGWVEKSLEDLIKNKVTEAINNLKRNLGLEPLEQESQLQDRINGIPLGEGETATGIQLKQGLMQRGFTKEEASAIVGNLWAESGFRTDATNPTSGAFGLMQWLSGRKSRLYKYAEEQGKSATDVNLQLDYIKWELKGGNPYETKQFEKAMAYGPDVASKTRGFAYEVERASSRELSSSMSKRIGAAESVYGGRRVAGEMQTPTRGMASNFKPPRSGLFNAIEYITGDRTHSNFELSGHGLRSNYHDHIAFRTIADKERAKNALRNAGIQIGSELRPGDRGYHGANLAIDIPGAQWGGSGAIGQKEFGGSKKVRAVLGLKGGSPSTKNIRSLRTQASYDRKVLAIQPVIVEKPIPMPQQSSSISFIGGGVNSNDNKSLLFVG